MGSHSYENEFRLQVHFHDNRGHFDMKGFAGTLVLKQRHKANSEMAIYNFEGKRKSLPILDTIKQYCEQGLFFSIFSS